MAEDYESMTVAQLKEVLKEQDLPISGKKSELIARLVDANGGADAADETTADAPEEAPSEDGWDDEDWDDDDDDDYDDEDWDDDDDEYLQLISVPESSTKETSP